MVLEDPLALMPELSESSKGTFQLFTALGVMCAFSPGTPVVRGVAPSSTPATPLRMEGSRSCSALLLGFSVT